MPIKTTFRGGGGRDREPWNDPSSYTSSRPAVRFDANQASLHHDDGSARQFDPLNSSSMAAYKQANKWDSLSSGAYNERTNPVGKKSKAPDGSDWMEGPPSPGAMDMPF